MFRCNHTGPTVCGSPGIHGGFVGSLELLQSGTLLEQERCGLLDMFLFFLTFSLNGAADLTQAAEGVGEVRSCQEIREGSITDWSELRGWECQCFFFFLHDAQISLCDT